MRFVLIATGLLVVGQARSQAPMALPQSPPPQLLIVAEATSGNGVIVCHYLVEVTRFVPVEREIDLGGGKTQRQRVQVPEIVREIRQVRLVVKDSQVFTAAGQK